MNWVGHCERSTRNSNLYRKIIRSMCRELGTSSKKYCNNTSDEIDENDDQNDQKKTGTKGELNLICGKL